MAHSRKGNEMRSTGQTGARMVVSRSMGDESSGEKDGVDGNAYSGRPMKEVSK